MPQARCIGSILLAPICHLRERFGIFLAELAAATRQVKDHGQQCCLGAVLHLLQTCSMLHTSHQAAMSLQGQLSHQASWLALATRSCMPTQVCLNTAASSIGLGFVLSSPWSLQMAFDRASNNVSQPLTSLAVHPAHGVKAQHADSPGQLSFFNDSAGQLVNQAMAGHGTRGLLATSPQPYTFQAVYSPVPKVATALPYGHHGGGGLKTGYSAGGAASACCDSTGCICSAVKVTLAAKPVNLASNIAPQPYPVCFESCNCRVPLWPA